MKKKKKEERNKIEQKCKNATRKRAEWEKLHIVRGAFRVERICMFGAKFRGAGIRRREKCLRPLWSPLFLPPSLFSRHLSFSLLRLSLRLFSSNPDSLRNGRRARGCSGETPVLSEVLLSLLELLSTFPRFIIVVRRRGAFHKRPAPPPFVRVITPRRRDARRRDAPRRLAIR